MKRTKFTESQIIKALKEEETGRAVSDANPSDKYYQSLQLDWFTRKGALTNLFYNQKRFLTITYQTIEINNYA